jgi:hypothetical protein
MNVTAVYATNAAGKACVVFLIQVQNRRHTFVLNCIGCFQGLPVILTGRFSCPTLIEESSFVWGGFMDDSLFIKYIKRVVMLLYPDIKFVCGPVILKAVPCPGRIVASEVSITKRAELLETRLCILMNYSLRKCAGLSGRFISTIATRQF